MEHPIPESEARALVSHVVTELQALGAWVTECGVSLDASGLVWMAEVNGRQVFVRTGEGRIRYRDVAKDLMGGSVDLLTPVTLTITDS